MRLGLCCLVAIMSNVACTEDNGNPYVIAPAGGATSTATGIGGGASTLTGAGGSTASPATALGGNSGLATTLALGGGTTVGGATAIETGGSTNGGGTALGGGTSTGGAASDPFAATVTPTNTGATWTFTFGRNKFVVDAAVGARIIEFSIDGTNALMYGAAITDKASAGGSTVWSAPQSAWSWPPPPAIDFSAYTATVADNVLTLVGKTDSSSSDGHTVTNLSVTKRFWVNETSGLVSCEYELINQGTSAASWAVWENSRVQRGGFTFFPEGGAVSGVTYPDSFAPLTLVKDATSGITWLDFDTLTFSTAGKTDYSIDKDGAEGWLAHVNKFASTKNYLFLRQFADTTTANLPAGHGEIRLWSAAATATKAYVEVENVGPKKSLAAKGTLKRTVRWSLSEVPATATVSAKSATLVDYVKSQLVAGASVEPVAP